MTKGLPGISSVSLLLINEFCNKHAHTSLPTELIRQVMMVMMM